MGAIVCPLCGNAQDRGRGLLIGDCPLAILKNASFRLVVCSIIALSREGVTVGVEPGRQDARLPKRVLSIVVGKGWREHG